MLLNIYIYVYSYIYYIYMWIDCDAERDDSAVARSTCRTRQDFYTQVFAVHIIYIVVHRTYYYCIYKNCYCIYIYDMCILYQKLIHTWLLFYVSRVLCIQWFFLTYIIVHPYVLMLYIYAYVMSCYCLFIWFLIYWFLRVWNRAFIFT